MNIQEAINKHEASLNELVGFHEQAHDEHNKQFLDSEIKRLRSKIGELKRTLEPAGQPIRYRTLENYSWEQTNDLIKIYINRSDLSNKTIAKESCKVQLLDNDRTAVIMVDNTKLVIKNLAHPVKVVEESLVKFTKNFVIICLTKVDNQKWMSLQKTSGASAIGKGLDDFKPGENDDPSQSMMNLMKKMYNEGDDEMKKMINKAWCEKQNTNSFM